MLPGGIARWLPVLAVSIAVVPVGFLAVRALDARSRRHGVPPEVARRRSISEVGMVAGTLPWIWMTLTPLPVPRSMRLVPLRDLADQLAGAPVTAFFQVGGNLLLLSAFGFGAAARWRFGLPVIAVLAAAGSLTVETLQYVLSLGRVSSVDDILLNTAGAVLAAVVSRRYWSETAMPYCRYQRGVRDESQGVRDEADQFWSGTAAGGRGSHNGPATPGGAGSG